MLLEKNYGFAYISQYYLLFKWFLKIKWSLEMRKRPKFFCQVESISGFLLLIKK